MLDIKSIAIEPEPTQASFEPYGRLFRMLMPSLRGVVVHDGYAKLLWASDEWDLGDDPEIVNDAIANALTDPAEFAGILRIDADRAVYSFAVRGEHIEFLGVVSMLARLSGSRTEGRPLQYVRQLVQPALECLRRELSLRSQAWIPRARSWGARARSFIDAGDVVEPNRHRRCG